MDPPPPHFPGHPEPLASFTVTSWSSPAPPSHLSIIGAPPSSLTSAAASTPSPTIPFRPSRAPSKATNRCALSPSTSLAPQTSPPATNAAGISRSTLSSPSDHGQGPNCKAFKTSRVLSAKRSFSFYSFCSELQKFLEKCEVNFVLIVLLSSIIWCEEFEIFPCVASSKNKT